MTAQRFRKKPVEIEAMRFDPATLERAHEIAAWAPGTFSIEPRDTGLALIVPTKEGAMKASPGDWIIKGIAGEFYPCKPDIFAATYDGPLPQYTTGHCEENKKVGGCQLPNVNCGWPACDRRPT
jgi:hypothetical protein